MRIFDSYYKQCESISYINSMNEGIVYYIIRYVVKGGNSL